MHRTGLIYVPDLVIQILALGKLLTQLFLAWLSVPDLVYKTPMLQQKKLSLPTCSHKVFNFQAFFKGKGQNPLTQKIHWLLPRLVL